MSAPNPGTGALLPLAGLRILDLSTFVAGPLCTLTLAQLGAEVTRVDPSGGRADTRRWPLAPSGESVYWSNLNRGKDIVALDTTTEPGLRELKRLIADTGPDGGIVVTNAVGQPRLGYDELRTARADLIHVLIQGKRDGSTAVDYTVNAECGIADVTGPATHVGPVNHVLPAWDVACGLHAAVAILAADRSRRVGASGQQVEIALHDVALATMGNLGFFAESYLTGRERAKYGNRVFGLLAGDFEVRGGRRIMVALVTGRHWSMLVRGTGLSPVMTSLAHALGVDFATTKARFDNQGAILAVLQAWFLAREAGEVEHVLDGASVPWSYFKSTADACADEMSDGAHQPSLFRLVDQPGIGSAPVAASPIQWGGSWLGGGLTARVSDRP